MNDDLVVYLLVRC